MADKPGLGDIAVITRRDIARKQGRLRRNVKSGTRDIHRLFYHRRGVVCQSQQVTNFQCSGNFIVEAFIFARQEIPSLTNASDTPLTDRVRRRLSSICQACSSRCCSNSVTASRREVKSSGATRASRMPLRKRSVCRRYTANAYRARWLRFPDDYAGWRYRHLPAPLLHARSARWKKQYHDKAEINDMTRP